MRYLVIILIFCCGTVNAQVEDAWVYFTDKQQVEFYMSQPEQMLSAKALQRRQKQNIPLDEHDVPISSDYISQLKNSAEIDFLAKSKWLNAVHVRGELLELEKLSSLNIVEEIVFLDRTLQNKAASNQKGQVSNKFEKVYQLSYGLSSNQIEMLGVQHLHSGGFQGEGMTIAVMDAGFPGVNYFSAFDSIRKNKQILGGYNFVDRNLNIYSRHPHGTSVLSTMGGFVKDSLIGTAPKADYYLFITEDYLQEHPLEESLWVEAAEYADSLGVDIINTSLGYSTFDNPKYNHKYSELDGKTTFISRGAEMAASRGIIVVNSAGNEGNDPWTYITAPADANSVLTVGAVDSIGELTSFSSIGPTADGRIKPDVVAQGKEVVVIRGDGLIGMSSGTSFSSPIIAGAVASFWQLNPNKTSDEIVQMVKELGNQSGSPDEFYGYGIPNFENIILETEYLDPVEELSIYPNPVSDYLFVDLPEKELPAELKVFSIFGHKILQKTLIEERTPIYLEFLNKGIYIVTIGDKSSIKIIKH